MNGLKNILFGTGMFGLRCRFRDILFAKSFSINISLMFADIQAFYKQNSTNSAGFMEGWVLSPSGRSDDRRRRKEKKMTSG